MHAPSLYTAAWEAAAAAGLVLRQLVVGVALGITALVAGRTALAWLGAGGRRRRAPGAAAPARMAAAAMHPSPAGSSGSPAPRLVLGGRLETAAVATPLGLVVVALAGLLLGLAGWLRPGPVLLVAAGIHLAGLPAWRALMRELRRSAGRPDGSADEAGDEHRPPSLGASPRRALRLAAIAAALLPFALLTLYPPTAFDATLYHLPYARAFAASGSLPFLPDLRVPIFPQLAETLFAVLWPFGGDLAAHGLALLATLSTAALLLAWGRRVSPAAGWIAAAAWLGSPVVVYLAGTAYVEPELVLFATAALYAVTRSAPRKRGLLMDRRRAPTLPAGRWREGGSDDAWLTLAAVFAGAAASTKYLGLIVLGMVAVAAVATPPPGPRPARWRRLARVAAASGIVIVPWYGRILAATGNPVFPFMAGVFGSSPWSPLGFHTAAEDRAHLGDLAVRLLRLPWDLVFARQRLGGYPPYSPVFLLALPALLLGAALLPRVRILLLAAAAYALAVFALLPDARYLLVALPLVCVALGDTLAAGLAMAASRARRAGRPQAERWAATAAAVLALAIALPGWCYAGYRLYRQGPVPVTPAGRDAYLARALPVYAAIRYLDRTCGSCYTLYAIHAENMAYFAGGRFLGDWTGPAAYQRVVPADGDARLLFGRLRSLGADHLLTVEGDPGLPPIFGPAFGGLFQRVYADGRARLFALRGAGCEAARDRRPAGALR